MELGCDARGHSRAGNNSLTWYCVVVAGRPSFQLNTMREVRNFYDALPLIDLLYYCYIRRYWWMLLFNYAFQPFSFIFYCMCASYISIDPPQCQKDIIE